MAEYLTEAAYKRWYRQYQINLANYLDILDSLRIRMDALPFGEGEEIQTLINEIDEHLDLASPRNFSAEPLEGFEKFSENCKVMVNLVRRLLGKPDRFLGLYQEEKNRTLKVHQDYKFKEKINQLKEKIEANQSMREDEPLEAFNPVAAG